MANPENPEEILKAYEGRAMSDGEAVDEGGAYGFTGDNPNPRLEFSPYTIKRAHGEMTKEKIEGLPQRKKEVHEKMVAIENVILRDPINFTELKKILGLENPSLGDAEVLTLARQQLYDIRMELRHLMEEKENLQAEHEKFFKTVIDKDSEEN